MGFSTSAAAAIIFVGVFVSIGMIYPSTAGSVEEVNDALGDQEDRVLEQRNTDITIDDVRYNTTSDTVTVNVTNTGTTTLDVNETDLLFDGTIQDTDRTNAVAGVTGRSLWAPGETLTVTVTTVPTAPTRVKFVTGPGVSRATDNVTVV